MLSRSLYKDVLRDVPEDLGNDEQNRQRAAWHVPKGLGFFARAALRLERGIAKYQVRAPNQGVNWDIVGGRQRWVDLVIRGKATTEAHRYILLRNKLPVPAGVLASYGSMIPLAGLWHWINWVCKYILKGTSQILGELELQLAYRYLV